MNGERADIVVDAGWNEFDLAGVYETHAPLLAAADESRYELADGANLAKACTLADRVYVYYNNQDMALAISELAFHDFIVRLGVDGPPNKDDFKAGNLTPVDPRLG